MKITQDQAEDLRAWLFEEARDNQARWDNLSGTLKRIPEWEDASPNDWDEFHRQWMEDIQQYQPEGYDVDPDDEALEYEDEERQHYYWNATDSILKLLEVRGTDLGNAINDMPEWASASPADWTRWANQYHEAGGGKDTVDAMLDTLGIRQ